MRKIKEPNEVAFNPRVSEECWNRNEALKYRSNQFWANIEVQETKDKNQYAARQSAIERILNYLSSKQEKLISAPETLNLWSNFDERIWEEIKFIISFNIGYLYYYQEEKREISDYLDEEVAVQYDVIKALTSYILEGAALSSRIGSPAYDKWVDALVMLKDEYDGSKNYKSVDLVAEAYARTWGDVRTWIYIKERDNLKKTKKIVKNKKK